MRRLVAAIAAALFLLSSQPAQASITTYASSTGTNTYSDTLGLLNLGGGTRWDNFAWFCNAGFETGNLSLYAEIDWWYFNAATQLWTWGGVIKHFYRDPMNHYSYSTDWIAYSSYRYDVDFTFGGNTANGCRFNLTVTDQAQSL